MNKQEISELITNMMEANAGEEEMYRAVEYSMDVLNCEKSYMKLNISELEKKYGTTKQNECIYNVLDPISARWFKTTIDKARQIEQKLHNHEYSSFNEYFKDCGLPVVNNPLYESRNMCLHLWDKLETVELELFPNQIKED